MAMAWLCPVEGEGIRGSGLSRRVRGDIHTHRSTGHTPLTMLSVRKRRAWLVAAGGAYCAGPGTYGHHAAVYVYVRAGHEGGFVGC